MVLRVTLSLVVLLWNPLHNRVLDMIEHRMMRRAASDRSHRLRLAHAVSPEVSPIVLTLPLIMLHAGHGLAEALAVQVGLTALSVGCAFAVCLACDWLFP